MRIIIRTELDPNQVSEYLAHFHEDYIDKLRQAGQLKLSFEMESGDFKSYEKAVEPPPPMYFAHDPKTGEWANLGHLPAAEREAIVARLRETLGNAADAVYRRPKKVKVTPAIQKLVKQLDKMSDYALILLGRIPRFQKGIISGDLAVSCGLDNRGYRAAIKTLDKHKLIKQKLTKDKLVNISLTKRGLNALDLVPSRAALAT